MATSIFRAETKNLDELAKRFGKSRTAFTKVAREELNGYGRNVVQSIQRFAPRDKGNFASGFTYTVKKTEANTMALETTWTPRQRPKDLLWWLLRGTGIYGDRHRPITPKRAKFLAFPGANGQMVFRRSVRGMRGRDFLSQAHQDLGSMRRTVAQRIGALTIQMLTGRMGR